MSGRIIGRGWKSWKVECMTFHNEEKLTRLFFRRRQGVETPAGADSADRDEREVCVLCRGDTGYRKTTPIAQRLYYVEGCGQLCEDCYAEIYLTSKSRGKWVGMDRWQS